VSGGNGAYRSRLDGVVWSYCYTRARRPRTQAVRERAPFQRVRNTPERPRDASVCHGARASRSHKGRVLGRDARFSEFRCAFAPHPPCPLLPQGEKGELGVLMPETEDGTQGLPEKPTPVRCVSLVGRPSSPGASRQSPRRASCSRGQLRARRS